jgi:hypothetical protein
MRTSSVRGQSLNIMTVACVLVRKSKCVGAALADGPKVNEICERLLLVRLSRSVYVRNLVHTSSS